MEPDDLRTSLRRGIAAALEGLAEAPPHVKDDAVARLFVLQTLGDALRASVDLPGALRRWMRELRDDDVCAALAVAAEEVPRWTTGAMEEALSFSLRRRDQIASALDALAWRALVHPPGVELAQSQANLEGVLARYDASLAASRSEVDSLLEERAYLADRGWRSGLRDDRVIDESFLPEASPNDAVIDAWMREGRFHRWVEDAASRDPDFADDLAFLVSAASQDARRDPTVAVSFVARRWSQRSGERVRVDVPVRPTVLAAASEDAPGDSMAVSLGLLSPLAAHASIDVTDGQATLTVHAAPGTVSSLVAGDRHVVPDADGACHLVLPTSQESISIAVHGSDETEVVFDLTFSPRLEG
ncbi:MAG: hypothetical protein Q8M65_01035 [Rhodoglobus sp.]|nr:hypothetical protein [Rhodoglobus sp.]